MIAGRRLLLLLAATWLLPGSGAAAPPLANRDNAPVPAPKADPSDFGLIVPESGLVRRGAGRRVLVKDASDKEVVAMVHAEIAERRIVVMPDGRLGSFDAEQSQPTRQPFQAASKDQIATDLTGKFAGFRTKSTNRYLYVYNTSKEFYTATSRILETMYPAVLAYFKRQKFPVHDPATPLVVIMFRTEEEFQQYHRMPEGVVAYYSGVSNHVVMYEEGKLNKLAPGLALEQSIATIAHEGVHQILHNIGVQERLSHWPIWVSEGLAEYFAPTSTDNRLRWKGVGKVNEMRMFELERYLKRRPPDSHGDMVEHTVAAVRLTSTGYATAWALTHYLAQRKKDKFFAYLSDISKAQPFEEGLIAEGRTEAVSDKELFAKHFGSNYIALEDDLVKYLQGLSAGKGQ